MEAYLARQRRETDEVREKSARRQWRRRQDEACAALGVEAEAAETLTEEECAAVEETLAGLAAVGIAFYEKRPLSLILGILAGMVFGAAVLYGLREILKAARKICTDLQKESLEKK